MNKLLLTLGLSLLGVGLVDFLSRLNKKENNSKDKSNIKKSDGFIYIPYMPFYTTKTIN